MLISITSIELKSPFKFFPLSIYALNILNQLNATNCKEFKKKGIWTTHYTMTLWENDADMKAFARSGAHQEAMQKGGKIAKEIRTLIIEGDQLPNWKEAKAALIKEGKSMRY